MTARGRLAMVWNARRRGSAEVASRKARAHGGFGRGKRRVERRVRAACRTSGAWLLILMVTRPLRAGLTYAAPLGLMWWRCGKPLLTPRQDLWKLHGTCG